MSSFSKERLQRVGREMIRILPAAAHVALIDEIAVILHHHMGFPIEGETPLERLLCGGGVLREAKAQWLRGFSVGLPVVRMELSDALDRFAAKLGIEFDHASLLREWALIVDPEWDEKVSPPTVNTFVNFSLPVVRQAIRAAQRS
jgi:hypothetical protein